MQYRKLQDYTKTDISAGLKISGLENDGQHYGVENDRHTNEGYS